MARSATKSGRRPKPDARVSDTKRPQQRRGGSGTHGSELFFERIRRNAKWVFVVLAVVFAVGFVGLGVGSGSGGLGDLLSGNFSGLFGGSGSPSVRKAEKRVQDHPNNPAALRALATALQATTDRREEAIAPLERYTQLRPRDGAALEELAVLYQERWQRVGTEAQTSASAATAVQPSAALALGTASSLGQTLSQDPIAQAVQSAASQEQTAAQDRIRAAAQAVTSTYERLAVARPDDPSVWQQLGQFAVSSQDYTTAIRAYRRFLKIAPEDPTAPDVKQQLKQIEAYVKSTQAGPAAGSSG